MKIRLILILLCGGLLTVIPCHADDTAVFGKGTVQVKPNVLIILDTSGSMDNLFNLHYDPDKNYSQHVTDWNTAHPGDLLNAYTRTHVYYATGFDFPVKGTNAYSWELYDDIADADGNFDYTIAGVNCASARSPLTVDGKWLGFVSLTHSELDDDGNPVEYTFPRNADCTDWRLAPRFLATGNYLCYRQLKFQPKIEIAKTVIQDVIRNNVASDANDIEHDKMNIGVMFFNERIPYDLDECYIDGKALDWTAGPGDSDARAAAGNMDEVLWWKNNQFFESIGHPGNKVPLTVDEIANCSYSGKNNKDALRNDGHWYGAMYSCGFAGHEPGDCGGLLTEWRTRNYENYNLISDLFEDDGGWIVGSIGSYSGDLIDNVKSAQAKGQTPLAESLAEAGLYFHGIDSHEQKSWANPDCYYPKPGDYDLGRMTIDPRPSPSTQAVCYRCQKNFVIVITDGKPWNDDDGDRYGKKIFGGDYFFGEIPKGTATYEVVYDEEDGLPEGVTKKYTVNTSSDSRNSRLDEVAKVLYETDIIAYEGAKDKAGVSFNDTNNDSEYAVQRIRTYTVGLDGIGRGRDGFLNEAAIAGHGIFKEALSMDEMRQAFDNILQDIYRVSTGFASSAVPVSSDSSLYSGDCLYLPVFEPSFSGNWPGNLKKYALFPDGTINNRNGEPATGSDGLISPTAGIDLWDEGTALPDGYSYTDTVIGGVGEKVMNTQARRHFYTTVSGTGGSVSLRNEENNGNNSAAASITSTLLGVSDGVAVDTVLNYLMGINVDKHWPLGDLMHSSPLIGYYGDPLSATNPNRNKAVIYVGSNDGFLHCYVDDDKGTPTFIKDGTDPRGWKKNDAGCQDDAVIEAWSFVPRDQLPRVKYLHQTYRSLSGAELDHPYYVDASPVSYEVGDKKYLAFGRRRGGSAYTILETTEFPQQGTGPTHVKTWGYDNDDEADTSSVHGQSLGQSWGAPAFCRLGTASALIIPGGYDTNQDNLLPAADSDTKGCLVYAVDAVEGDILTQPKIVTAGCVVDVAVFDRDFDVNHAVDTIYVPEVQGELWRCADGGNDNADWVQKKIFSAPANQKFFHAPDVVLERSFEYVFIGSGDRANPQLRDLDGDGSVSDGESDDCRFYAIKMRKSNGVLRENTTDWPTEGADGLVDVTIMPAGLDPSIFVSKIKSSSYGWFIRLTAPGEKVVSRPITLAGVVYFTTYQPPAPRNTSDPCERTDDGIGRLYAINYMAGQGVYDRFVTADADTDYDDSIGDKRSLVLGKGMPPQPTISVHKDVVQLIVGSQNFEIDVPLNAVPYYWMINNGEE